MAETDTEPTDTVQFFNIKSNHFRVIHMDGALGSLTPSGAIHVAVYSERPAIPRSTRHPVDDQGRLGKATYTEGRTGVVRELEADLVLTREVAEKFRNWLTRRIDELDKLTTGDQVALEGDDDV